MLPGVVDAVVRHHLPGSKEQALTDHRKSCNRPLAGEVLLQLMLCHRHPTCGILENIIVDALDLQHNGLGRLAADRSRVDIL